MVEYLNRGDAAQIQDIQLVSRALRGHAIGTGVEVSKGSNAMETDVTSGTAFVDGAIVNVSAQTVTHDAGDTDPRHDVVYVNSSGTLKIEKGTPASAIGPDGATFADDPFVFWSPAPDPPDLIDGVPLAQVAIPAAATDYDAGTQFRELRPTVDMVFETLEARQEVLLPQFDETGNAPTTERNLIQITGNGTDTKGVYFYDGTDYVKTGAGLTLSDLTINSNRDWNGNNITNVGELQVNESFRVHNGRGSFNLPEHHTNYADGLSSAEISRRSLASDEKFEVWMLDVTMKGGGSNSNFTVEIRDESDNSTLASTSDFAQGASTPLGTSAAGADVTVRVTNSTGSAKTATISGQIYRVST